HLARKILIRTCSRAESHVEILAHRRSECDLVQKGAITTKSISIQRLQVNSHPAWTIDFAGFRNNEDLVQRKSHTLSQLIVSVKCVAVERAVHRIDREVVAKANALVVVRIDRSRWTCLGRIVERECQIGKI